MTSVRHDSPGQPPVSSAGPTPPKTTGEIDDILRLLPPQQETDALLAEAAAHQQEMLQRYLSQTAHATDAGVIDDPRYLIVDETPLEDYPE